MPVQQADRQRSEDKGEFGDRRPEEIMILPIILRKHRDREGDGGADLDADDQKRQPRHALLCGEKILKQRHPVREQESTHQSGEGAGENGAAEHADKG